MSCTAIIRIMRTHSALHFVLAVVVVVVVFACIIKSVLTGQTSVNLE